MIINHRLKLWVGIAACLCAGWASQAAAAKDDLILSTAPTQSFEDTRALYTPLAQFLSKTTGKNVVLRPAHNFIGYQSKLRHDRYDIVFDGPHLTAWRVNRKNHEPVVRFPGQIRIVVATKEESEYKALADLDRARVCAFASPNMLTMVFLSQFPNPVRQPHLLREQGFKDLVDCLQSGRGDVAVLRDKQWDKVDQTGLRLIPFPEHSYPERTFTVSERVDLETREKIRAALLSEEGKIAAEKLLSRFKKSKFVPATKAEYANMDELLAPLWGFHD